MKATVVRKFIDKHTGVTHEVGDVIEVTKKRLKEIQETGDFVEEIKDIKREEKDAEREVE